MANPRESHFTRNNRKPEMLSVIPQQAQCADVLRAHRQEVIDSFLQEVRRKVPAAKGKEDPVVINSLPDYLDQLAHALSRGAKIEEAHDICKICEIHGAQRAALSNYTMEQVLFEYAILRRIILTLLRRETEITNEESDVIHEAIQEGMLQAASEFTKAHAGARNLLEQEKRLLSDRTAKAQEQVRESYQTLKEMTDSLPVLFWWSDEGGKGNHYNRKFYEYTGLSPDVDPESIESFHAIVHPDDLPVNLLTREEALQLKSTARFEERLRRWDGQYRWHLVHSTPVFHENGTLKRWYATSIDIHEQKMAGLEMTLEAASLKSQTERLSSRNTELDRFAAIAAHDLKSPLNSIIQFTQLLAEQYRGQLGEEADQYIDFIVNAGKRMTDLIDNLLEFSRSGVLDRKSLVPVSIQEVLGTVRKNLLAEIQQTDARLTMNPNLPNVMGNQLQITQLFQNLVANAIKFHKPDQPPMIHIDFSDNGKTWCFSVADQGIGMDPKYSQKIFEIFSKVPSRKHYEGSGIGLAVCKRIVEAHGGKISFQSRPHNGATFYFTLPKVS